MSKRGFGDISSPTVVSEQPNPKRQQMMLRRKNAILGNVEASARSVTSPSVASPHMASPRNASPRMASPHASPRNSSSMASPVGTAFTQENCLQRELTDYERDKIAAIKNYDYTKTSEFFKQIANYYCPGFVEPMIVGYDSNNNVARTLDLIHSNPSSLRDFLRLKTSEKFLKREQREIPNYDTRGFHEEIQDPLKGYMYVDHVASLGLHPFLREYFYPSSPLPPGHMPPLYIVIDLTFHLCFVVIYQNRWFSMGFGYYSRNRKEEPINKVLGPSINDFLGLSEFVSLHDNLALTSPDHLFTPTALRNPSMDDPSVRKYRVVDAGFFTMDIVHKLQTVYLDKFDPILPVSTSLQIINTDPTQLYGQNSSKFIGYTFYQLDLEYAHISRPYQSVKSGRGRANCTSSLENIFGHITCDVFGIKSANYRVVSDPKKCVSDRPFGGDLLGIIDQYCKEMTTSRNINLIPLHTREILKGGMKSRRRVKRSKNSRRRSA